MRMEVSGVFNSWETLLTKSVFCRASFNSAFRLLTMSQLPMPMASTSTATSRPSVSLGGAGGLRERGGVDEIRGDLPMRQRVADFRGDERSFPICRKSGARKGDGFGVVVEQRQANFIAQRGFGLHETAQAVHEAVQIQLRAENQAGFAIEPVPEHELEFVLQKPREHAVGFIADELGEFRLGGNDLGQIILRCAGGIFERVVSRVLRADFARFCHL